jgi:(S)-2-hydroxyglutarate dehydrogenase
MLIVLGGGCLGLQVAIQSAKRGISVLLIEKERRIGLHASGRNSGVLHAGLYYPHQSLKGKLTQKGNQLLRKYCIDRGIQVNACGKLVVAKNEKQLEMLDLLYKRAVLNQAVKKEFLHWN